ncbi:MAG TPA: transcriptional regulator, partial [Iamia sp.]|nr:transcriptional regulator [Iamia sp.]
RWAAHDVKFHRSGVKRFHHPVVGDLTLTFEALLLPADPGQQMLVYTPEPASAAHEAMGLLASWAGAETTTERTT